MSERAELSVQEGQQWRRKSPGREVLRIERVWQGYITDKPELWAVRAVSVRGGQRLVCPPDYIETYYVLLP